jgi:hypothetical protein
MWLAWVVMTLAWPASPAGASDDAPRTELAASWPLASDGQRPGLAVISNRTSSHVDDDDDEDDSTSRRLEVLFQYQPRKHTLASPKYKEKTVRPEVVAWDRNVFFNAPGARHKRRRSAAYVALAQKELDPAVKALVRFAEETKLEVTTAAKLRSGLQREGSFPQPFHAALLVGPHVSAGCVAGMLGGVSSSSSGSSGDARSGQPQHKAGCERDDVAYFTTLRDPLRFAQDHFYRLTRKLAVELASVSASTGPCHNTVQRSH